MHDDGPARNPCPLRKRVATAMVVGAVGIGVCNWAVSAQKRLWAARAVEAANGDIKAIGSAVELWALDHGDEYPEQLASLFERRRNCSGRMLRPDPWGNAYGYSPPTCNQTGSFTIWSCGPDGVSGTTDDIVLSIPVRRELQELAAE